MRVNLRQERYDKKYSNTENLPSNLVINGQVSETPEAIQETGLIVKIVFDEPISDAKQFKVNIKSIFFIYYKSGISALVNMP